MFCLVVCVLLFIILSPSLPLSVTSVCMPISDYANFFSKLAKLVIFRIGSKDKKKKWGVLLWVEYMHVWPRSFDISSHLFLLHKEIRSYPSEVFFSLLILDLRLSCLVSEVRVFISILFKEQGFVFEVCTYFFPHVSVFFIVLRRAPPNLALFSRQIKRHCAEPFTEYWTCIDYSGLQLFRRCRKQQAKFDECVLDKLGWVRPDLGELSKVKSVSCWQATHSLRDG